MRVSAVIPAHNRAHTLSRAIRSILSQTERPDEIIVVDDRSTDGTEQLVTGSFRDVRYMLNEHAAGPAGARNQGIERATGDYIAFLDSDDEWFPRHLESSLRCLKKHNLGASYALWYRLRGASWEKYSEEWLGFMMQDLGLKSDDGVIVLGDKIAEYMVAKPFWCFHTDTLVARRDALLACGTFKENFHSAEDLEFSFRLLLKTPACLIKEYHAYYYEGDDNIVALRRDDHAKLRAHHIEMVKAFGEIGRLVETSPFIEDKGRCRDQLSRKIAKYEVLC